MIRQFIQVATLLAVVTVVPISGRTADIKLGVVNVQDIIDTVDEGKAAKSALEKAMLDRKKDLEDKKKDFQKLQESYDKQKLVLSPSALADKQKELETKQADLQKQFMSAQADMQKKEMELTGDILKKIRSVVSKIGQEGAYSMIIEKNEGGVVYYKDAYDLTKQVIEQYNRVYKK